MIIILMGVSGCGKSTVGKRLASILRLPFLDADDLHPPDNIRKMTNGIPLDDRDREPWLQVLKSRLEEMKNQNGGILACSALKAAYRKVLYAGAGPNAKFIFLKGSRDVIRKRLTQRADHFMKEALLDSQFRDLEEPKDALILPIEGTPEDICSRILASLETEKIQKT